jgi:flavin-dependent dehydrogenase
MAADPQLDVFDAAVVGAGPAGSATARWLAQRGWRVALLERTRFEAPRIGESVAPNVQGSLRELGLWSEFLALAPLPSWGTCSLWGDAVRQSHSHLLNPYGCGWHVDRRAFDRMLARAAVTAGTSLFEGLALQRSVHRNGYWWLQTKPFTLQAEATPQTLRARVLIDATGRRAQVARALGAQRILLDRLVGVAVRWSGVNAAERSHLLVEAAREGWWYSAPLPCGAQNDVGTMIAILMTDADLCGRLRLIVAERWQARLQSTQATRQRLDRAHRISTPQVHCAQSQRLRRDGASDAGPWLAVGDAALAVDPISGSGVPRALRTARAAADTVSDLLARPRAWEGTLAAYEAERDKECTSYLFERAQYYSAEQRFDTPFWQRRQVMQRRPTGTANRTLAVADT